MSNCTLCAQPPKYCDCETDVQFVDLEYTNDQYSVAPFYTRRINGALDERTDDFKVITETLGHLEPTATNVRLIHLWAVGSIQTKSAVLDALTADIDRFTYDRLKTFLENTTDGEKKWEKVQDVWNSDIPEQVADLLQDEKWVDAQAVLSGLSEDEGRDFHYVRPTKANLITGAFGDPDALCLDSRRLRVLRPLLKDMLPEVTYKPDQDHPTDPLGTYRHEQANRTNDSVPAWSDDFLQDKLDRSPEELRLITTEILDALESNTRANRDEISHILFCLGGETTFHESLQELVN